MHNAGILGVQKYGEKPLNFKCENKVEQICLVNAHWCNHGDEAAIIAILQEIINNKPNAKITILFKDRKEVLDAIKVGGKQIEHMSLQFLPNYVDYCLQLISNGKIGNNVEMKKTIRELDKADYIIYAPGGAVISDRFWWKKQLEYLLPFIYSIMYKKAFYVASPSIGPFEKRYRIRNIVRNRIFRKIRYFYVRENISYSYIQQINKCKNVIVTTDSAFCNEIDHNTVEKQFEECLELTEFMSKYDRIIGVTITELEWNIKYKSENNIGTRIYAAAKELLEKLAEEGYGIILIPQLFGNQNDRKVLEKYVNDKTYILNENYDASFQQYLISKLHLVIGFRYHSNIFAAKMCTPFLPVIYEEKMEGFINEAGLERYAVSVEDVSAYLLYEKVKLIEAEYEDYKQILVKKIKLWGEKAEITKASLAEFMGDIHV